jgi:hypothetical protein
VTLGAVVTAVLVVGCAASDPLRVALEQVVSAPFQHTQPARAVAAGLTRHGDSQPGQPGPAPASAPAATASPSDAAARPAAWWHPRPGITWQLQLRGTIDTATGVGVVVLDPGATSATTIAALHATGTRAVCRLTTGIWDAAQPGAGAYGPALLGGSVDGYANRRYLDLRQLGTLGALIGQRLGLCAALGFDGVDPEGDDTVIDAGADGIGFPVTYDAQLAFDRMVIADAHALGLAAGLHTTVLTNTTERFVTDLLPVTDFALVERCAATEGCAPLGAFPRHGKPVFHAEYLTDYPEVTPATYQAALTAFCPASKALGFSSILKAGTGTGSDAAWRQTC